MCALLGDVTNVDILEPAVGHGAFIQSLIGRPKSIDAVDVNPESLSMVRNKFPDITLINADFIDLFVTKALERHRYLKKEYDAIIANPPYGLKMPIEYRKKIKKANPDVYARESYGLFLHFGILLLKKGGRYVYIIPDTFIHSVNHRPLRRMLIKYGAPSHIIQFKSGRFETVNFGYGNLCIIAGNARELRPTDQIRWVDATEYKGPLSVDLFNSESVVMGTSLLELTHTGWLHPLQRDALEFCCDTVTLGEIAECRTGIYSGDNTRFFGCDHSLGKQRGNGHPIDWDAQVRMTPLSDEEKKKGVSGEPKYVPLIKGGHRSPFENTHWAVNWSTDAIRYYSRDGKARLQNSQFYFKKGLAVPMVTSGRISASLFEQAVFDQGVVGVFPNDSAYISFLLIYLNSELVARKLKRAINASTNNSANYMKRLPVPVVNSEILTASEEIVARAKSNGWETTEEERRLLIEKATTLSTN